MQSEYITPLARLVDQFSKLPGIGTKTAARLAFAVLSFPEAQIEAFADALIGAKRDVKMCKCCCNLSDSELCSVCTDTERDGTTICVVENARDVLAIEKVREYRGLYHVLGGVLSPMRGIGVEQLYIKELLARLADGKVKEIIVATDPTVEGESTAMYLARLLNPMQIKVSRLAYGIPVGGNLEYADEITLQRAIEGRRTIG